MREREKKREREKREKERRERAGPQGSYRRIESRVYISGDMQNDVDAHASG